MFDINFFVQFLYAAQYLVLNNVEAMIVGPEMTPDPKGLAVIADKAQNPIFSLNGSVSMSEVYPTMFQVSHSEAT